MGKRCEVILTLSTLGEIFSSQHTEIFFLIFPKTHILTFHADCLHCRLSTMETIRVKCQILFSGKVRKIAPICRLPN